MRIRTPLLLTLVGLALVPIARPAMVITRTPVTFTASSLTTVSPGTEWVSRNTLHVRNEVDTGLVTGDLTGTATIVLSTDLNVTNPTVGFAGSEPPRRTRGGSLQAHEQLW